MKKIKQTEQTKTRTRLKKNDLVVVLTGKNKGKQGKILEINAVVNKAYVEGINYQTNYERPTQQNPKGSITKKEGPVHISNISLFCPKCDKGVRTRNVISEEGIKNRVCAVCGDII